VVLLQIIKLGIEELTPYENNAKKHTPEQIEQIKNSIQAFGNIDPLGIAGENNVIYVGNGRYIALKELGYKEAYCIRLDHLTEQERKAYAIAHNKLTMNTGFDNDLLRAEMESLQDIDFDLELMGFEEWELDSLLNSLSDEDLQEFFAEKEDKPKKPKTITCPHCGEIIEI
jgi:ParB-like chromosome segregation protein Spo0J